MPGQATTSLGTQTRLEKAGFLFTRSWVSRDAGASDVAL
jgi:hypothetical protein